MKIFERRCEPKYLFKSVSQTSGFSRCVKDPLVILVCFLLYGRVVVSLTYSPFPFSISFKPVSVHALTFVCYRDLQQRENVIETAILQQQQQKKNVQAYTFANNKQTSIYKSLIF